MTDLGGPLAETRIQGSGNSLADTESSPLDAAMTIWLTIRAPCPTREAV